MQKITKMFIVIFFIATIVISFITGGYIKEKEYTDRRSQQCNTLISFAINKVEEEDLSNEKIREAIISNIYAAYQFCDNPNASEQLHNLWNGLIFEDVYIGKEDMLTTQLKDISDMIQIKD